MSKFSLICATVLLTGVLAGGPGPCEKAVVVTAPFFTEAITALEATLTEGKGQLDDFREELEAHQLTSDDYFNHSETITNSFNSNSTQVIKKITQKVATALGVSVDIVHQAMSTLQADSEPLSCILEQLKNVIQKYNSVQKEFADLENDLIERFKDLFKP